MECERGRSGGTGANSASRAAASGADGAASRWGRCGSSLGRSRRRSGAWCLARRRRPAGRRSGGAGRRADARPALALRPRPVQRAQHRRVPRPLLERSVGHRRSGGRAEPVAPRPHGDGHRRRRSDRQIQIESPELWNNPWIYFVEPGTLRFKEAEVPILREFLLRGGTAVLDDFHGPIEWDNVEQEFRPRLPRSRDRRAAAGASGLPLLLRAGSLPADPGAGLVLPGPHVGEGRLHVAPARDRGRPRPRHGAHQLEHRHGRRHGVVERRGVSRLRRRTPPMPTG